MPEEEIVRGHCHGLNKQSACHKGCPLKDVEQSRDNIIEVLRDFMKRVETEISIGEIDGLLAKLDVGSARQTVKDCRFKGKCYGCKDLECIYNPKYKTEKNKKIEQRVAEIEKAIKDGKVAFHNIYHNTINNRIKNICNALGMGLNAKESPKLTELQKNFHGLVIKEAGCPNWLLNLERKVDTMHNNFKLRAREKWRRMDNIEQILRKTLKNLADVGISGFIDESLLTELDKSGSVASSFTRRDSDPVGSTPTPDSRIHYLKTLPEYFQPSLERKKTFEIRINDRDFKVGDFLTLEEYILQDITSRNLSWGYTGREITVEVLYILKAEGSFFSFLDDYIIMGIRF